MPSATTIDSHAWYKLRNVAAPGRSLDVINDGHQLIDARLRMAQDGYYSGQFWHFRPSTTHPGLYNLCTMWLKPNKSLDVYGNDKTTPHLITTERLPGQQWMVQPMGDGTWRLSNLYSEGLVLAVDEVGRGLHLVPQDSLGGSRRCEWILQWDRPIRETGFELPATAAPRL